MKTFNTVLVNSLTASLTNTVVWFAVTFWAFLETRSVFATSIMAGIYLGTIAFTGFFLGSIVDRYRKKKAMLISSSLTLVLYSAAFAVYAIVPAEEFKNPGNAAFWIFIILILVGAIAGNIRHIALSTLVTILVPEDDRDKANGLVGTVTGVSFLAASIISGMVMGFFGMYWMMASAVAVTLVIIMHLLSIRIEESEPKHLQADTQKVDVRGTVKVIKGVPGLFALIFFNTFNNFLGGVFMALMDAYGLSLVSVQAWGTLWGFLSLGFIVGGLVVSKKGLSGNPLKTMFICNIVMWTICIFFTMHPSIIFMATGLFIYLCLIPVVEASEQTIVQKVIPLERQGRVFGFSQSIEQAASPVTAFLIGPIAQFVFIPFMTTGAGVDLIGGWFGTGMARGLALLFSLTGVVGLIVTLLAMRSYSYKKLSENYEN